MSNKNFIGTRLFKTDAIVQNQKEYEEIEEQDRTKLLLSQFKLRDENVPIVILISGMHGSGYSKLLNVLNEWMDTRFIETHVHRPESDEEADRPQFWKYWRVLPDRGMTGLFLGGWYTKPYLKRLDGEISKRDFESCLNDINHFEKLLSDDGVLLVKIWLEMSSEDQKKSIKNLPVRPDGAWRVTMDDWRNGFTEKKKKALVNQVLEHTHTTQTPWFSIPAGNAFERNLSVMHLLTSVFESRLTEINDAKNIESDQKTEEEEFKGTETNYLKELDLSKSLKRSKYTKHLKRVLDDIYHGVWRANQQKKSIVLVFEGSDAAGKGGVIRRLIRGLDARLYRVIQIGAPTKAEKSKHYLSRFWMQIPRAGFVTIYDRSWYGRVLVERVEKFAKDEEWQRAYEEINQFEKELTDSGIIVLKFWLEISEEEQMNRFQKREKTDYKQYKLTEEDWRNREKRGLYERAANDMIEFTSTKKAPWHVIPAEDKKYARVKVLKELNKVLSKLESSPDDE